MSDIHETVTEESVRFIAGTTKGDDWMRTRYQSVHVTFELPSQEALAKVLKDSAIGAGLTIANLPPTD